MDLLLYQRGQLFYVEDAEILSFPGTNRYFASFDFFVAANQHERYPLQGMLADFKAYLLISQVRFGPNANIIQAVSEIESVIGLIIGNIEHYYLIWSQPGRKQTGVLFNQNTDKALD